MRDQVHQECVPPVADWNRLAMPLKRSMLKPPLLPPLLLFLTNRPPMLSKKWKLLQNNDMMYWWKIGKLNSAELDGWNPNKQNGRVLFRRLELEPNKTKKANYSQKVAVVTFHCSGRKSIIEDNRTRVRTGPTILDITRIRTTLDSVHKASKYHKKQRIGCVDSGWMNQSINSKRNFVDGPACIQDQK